LLVPLDHAPSVGLQARGAYHEGPILESLRLFAAEDFAIDEVPGETMTITNGGLDAIDRVLREHVRPGDGVIVEDPMAPAVVDLVRASGLSALPVPMDAEGPRSLAFVAALGSGVRAVIVSARAQNPTGAALSAKRVAELAAHLRGRRDLIVIEIDPLGPAAGVPLASLAAAGMTRWAFVRPLSKFLHPDLRLAIVAGDELTIGRVRARQLVTIRWVSRILQQLAVTLWADPSTARRLGRAADVYSARRTGLLEALAAQGIAATAPSGYNVWIPLRDEARVTQSLDARGWVVAPGERFRLESGPGIRVTASTLSAAGSRRFAQDLRLALEVRAATTA
jgi:DNA-binding transcriptional MocR family regulator